MSIWITADKKFITFENDICYNHYKFKLSRPVTYTLKNITLKDGTPVIWGYHKDDYNLDSYILPFTIFGKTMDDVIKNACLQLIVNWLEDADIVNTGKSDPIVKYIGE